MNRIPALLLLAFTLPLAAHADEASHRAKAQELMSLLHTQQVVEQNAGSLKSQLAALAANTIGADPTPAKKADADDFLKQADQLIDAKLGWASLQSEITDIYAKNFTEEQLAAIISFYKTPAGTALLTNMHDINTQVSAIGSQRLTELKPTVAPLITAFREKESAVPTPAATTPPPAAAPAPAPTTTTPPAAAPKTPAPTK